MRSVAGDKTKDRFMLVGVVTGGCLGGAGRTRGELDRGEAGECMNKQISEIKHNFADKLQILQIE